MRGLTAVRRPRLRVLGKLAAAVHWAVVLGSIPAATGVSSSNSRQLTEAEMHRIGGQPALEELAVIQGHLEASGEKVPGPPRQPAAQAGTTAMHPGEDPQCARPHAVVEDSWRHVVHGRNRRGRCSDCSCHFHTPSQGETGRGFMGVYLSLLSTSAEPTGRTPAHPP
jgi:hypothetical protein